MATMVVLAFKDEASAEQMRDKLAGLQSWLHTMTNNSAQVQAIRLKDF